MVFINWEVGLVVWGLSRVMAQRLGGLYFSITVQPVWPSFYELSRESGEEDLGAAGLLRGTYSAGPVSQSCFKGESWLRAATLDDSKTPTPVLHNTSVVV